ncbi:L,D-transpeptidase family protein [Microaerobacter geothermalis]|uniref:L,D-transpeptidase n=1 Tax=Microaerobacter geothermalis TaxID=674972 RepID=UPI001F001871|nr:L,D-transpeptidase family protein [Microaerobacter geothermalis]MCF6093124.1 L,D-transpeptidase family protein [Microaerobacter geothermalis]
MNRRLKITFFLLSITVTIISIMSFITNPNYTVEFLNEKEFLLVIQYPFPMKNQKIEKDDIYIISEIPGTSFSKTGSWQNKKTLVIRMNQNDLPQGQKIYFSISNQKTRIGAIPITVKGSFTPKASLSSITLIPEKNVSTRNPVRIKFNTLIEESSMKSIKTDIKGTFTPVTITLPNGKKVLNKSEWEFIANEPLENNKVYNFVFPKGFSSKTGDSLDETRVRSFQTASKPVPIKIFPSPQSAHQDVYSQIYIQFDQEMKMGIIQLFNVTENYEILGKTIAVENRLQFKPDDALLPDSKYLVKVQGISKFNEPSESLQFAFETKNIGERLWVDVSLGEKHVMSVYRGKKLLRKMLVSGGRPGLETPKGVFYTKDKGPSFFSYRFQEGATYWVRLFDQYLIHSVPRDDNWKIKEDEHKKLGLPASHGCIRLDEEDARWFYSIVEQGTMVIIRD